MTRLTYLLMIAFAAALTLVRSAGAEQTYHFESVPNQSTVIVDGTSTVHDWTVKGTVIDGNVEFKADVPADAPTQAIKEALVNDPKVSVAVEIPANSLRSGKGDMDKKMYDALKRDKHPIISYRLTEAVVEKREGGTSATANDDIFQLQTRGELTVAGVTREIQMPMTLVVNDENNLRFAGRIALKMTDFKMVPPKAALGLIKSGDRVQVRVEWVTRRAEESRTRSAGEARTPAHATSDR